MNIDYLLKIQEKLNNLWNSIPEEEKAGRYSESKMQSYNELKNMFLGLGKMYYQDSELTFDDLQLKLKEEKEKIGKYNRV